MSLKGVRMVRGEDVEVGMRVDLGDAIVGNPPEVLRVERRPGGLIALHFEAGGVRFHHLVKSDARVRVVEPAGTEADAREAVVQSVGARGVAARGVD